MLNTYEPMATYKVLSDMTCFGVQLKAGDYLPMESPLRNEPGRIEALCRQRRLAPAVDDSASMAAVASGGAGPKPIAAREKVTTKRKAAKR